jgi:diguanylate cyclase (GGDEF)-like protein
MCLALGRAILRKARADALELADSASEGLAMCENGLIKEANASFAALLGRDRNQLRNQQIRSLIFAGSEETFSALTSNAPREIELITGADSPVPVEIAIRNLPDYANRCVYVIQDIRVRKQSEERIRYLADHDRLTGLPNRPTLRQQLEQKLQIAWYRDEQFAVFAIDLDRFKDINDVYGHAVGDAVLVEATRRLLKEVDAGALTARSGADEFIVVSSRCDTSWATKFAERLMVVFDEEFAPMDRKMPIGLSIGIAVYPSHGATAEKLLANANVALDRAKEQGGRSYCFYDTQMDLMVRERRALTQDLAQSLERGELLLHYQPQATVSSLTYTGFEALIRWRHPDRGFVSPAEFIVLAEESGLIHELGLWVLSQACAEAARWENPLDIAVNLSPLQFQQSDLPEQISTLLVQTGLPAHRLELEITETALIKDFDHAVSMLRRLKNLGLRIAMDDFGTGWSSLATLQAFPFDKLKLDKTFVDKIGHHDQAEMIIRSVLGLCQSLGIPVLAEGVETQEQLDFLRREGCDALQGYLLSRPAPIGEFSEFTVNNNSPSLLKARAGAVELRALLST